MIEGIPISALTPAGLLALIVLLIAFGRLVPRRTLEDMIEDRNQWRAAQRISEAARAELASQVTELLEHARTTDAFIRALPRAAVAFQQQDDRPAPYQASIHPVPSIHPEQPPPQFSPLDQPGGSRGAI